MLKSTNSFISISKMILDLSSGSRWSWWIGPLHNWPNFSFSSSTFSSFLQKTKIFSFSKTNLCSLIFTSHFFYESHWFINDLRSLVYHLMPFQTEKITIENFYQTQRWSHRVAELLKRLHFSGYLSRHSWEWFEKNILNLMVWWNAREFEIRMCLKTRGVREPRGVSHS